PSTEKATKLNFCLPPSRIPLWETRIIYVPAAATPDKAPSYSTFSIVSTSLSPLTATKLRLLQFGSFVNFHGKTSSPLGRIILKSKSFTNTAVLLSSPLITFPAGSVHEIHATKGLLLSSGTLNSYS